MTHTLDKNAILSLLVVTLWAAKRRCKATFLGLFEVNIAGVWLEAFDADAAGVCMQTSFVELNSSGTWLSTKWTSTTCNSTTIHQSTMLNQLNLLNAFNWNIVHLQQIIHNLYYYNNTIYLMASWYIITIQLNYYQSWWQIHTWLSYRNNRKQAKKKK
jgi:hypothetical protein